MAGSDKKGYDDFVKKQRVEFEADQKKKLEEREKQRIITPKPLCSLKCLPAKIINKVKDLSDSIKLFDFDQNAEVNKNIVASSDSDKPLESPKLYLNILYHDKVIPPLKKDRTNADTNDDKEWAIIPISFGPSKERWSGSGLKCIHIDAHVNTCVANVFKQSVKKIGAITNYILQKFQVVVKDHYILHTKSVKALKNKKYKAWRGANTEIADYVLPEGFHVDHYEKVLKKMEDMARRLNPEGAKRMDDEKNKLKKADVKMPTS